MPTPRNQRPTVGIVGFGAFGQLMARALRGHATLRAHDPDAARAPAAARHGVALASLAEVAGSPVVVLAVPVAGLEAAVAAVAPHLRPGALVLDVGSVKVGPAAILRAGLPAHVDIVATHPLFGPESARDGLVGHRIAVCPVRGRRARRGRRLPAPPPRPRGDPDDPRGARPRGGDRPGPDPPRRPGARRDGAAAAAG